MPQEPEEVAPPVESWGGHLRELDDRQLSDLAKDYNWLNGEAVSDESRAEFHRRRQAIIMECERRGLTDPRSRLPSRSVT